MNGKINWRKILMLSVWLIGIGLFLAVAIPTIGGVLNNLQGSFVPHARPSIAWVYSGYVKNPAHPTIAAKPGYTVHSVAYLWAKEAGLNDARLYIVGGDPSAPYSNPKTVLLNGNPGQEAYINPAFEQATLSYEIAVNLPANAPPTTTPVVWTRGLRADGTWPASSPWEGKGGHIGYLDGHMEWIDGKLSTEAGGASLVKFGTATPTVNIREALPPGAVILSAEPNPSVKRTP